MKTPETPKTNASAKPAETKGSSETISVDSKGNANATSKKAETATSSKPEDKGPAKDLRGTKDTSTANQTKSSANPAASNAPKSESKASDDTKKTAATSAKTGTGAKPKSGGSKALFLFVIIIVGALAAGWLTRTIWWREAQPVLAQYVPADILAEITPEGYGTAETDNTDITVANEPATSQTSEDTESNASNEDAPLVETDNLPPAIEDQPDTETAQTAPAANTAPLDDTGVVMAPELTERLSRLEGTIDALRERLNNERGDTLNSTVARRLAEIETRSTPIEELARVESELAGVANEIRDLSARLSTMEEEVRATSGLRVESRGQAIAMAVTILRDALQRGGPFVIALNQLERSAGDDPTISEQIAILKPLSEQGAPTLEKLRQSFPAMAQEAVAAATDDHSGSVLDATWANIKKLVPIRRVDAAGEESLEGRLVLAENALAQDDLDAAITALQGVEGDHAAAAVSNWLRAAENRQTLNQAIATLSSHAIGILTSNGAEGSQ